MALKPHVGRIREWTETGKTDDWIAEALGTSASSVQAFRSRNGIRRSPRQRAARRGPESMFVGVLDHGERDGWGLWLDPSVAEDPIWREHWSGVRCVVVEVASDRIVLEAVRGGRDAIEEPPPRGVVLSGVRGDTNVPARTRRRGKVDVEKMDKR